MKISLLLAAPVLFIAMGAYASDVNIVQSDLQFSESSIKIKAGDRLVFKNADTVTHNIQITDSGGNTDDKGLQRPGEIIDETLLSPGAYKARCGIHPGMKLKIDVQ